MNKILLAGNSDIVIYNFRYEFIEELIKNNYEVSIIAPYGPRIEKLKKIGCNFYDINIERHGTNPLKEIELLNIYRKYIDEIKPDIVFSYTIKPNIYLSIVCRKKNIPIFVTITGLGTAVEYPGWQQFVTVMLYKYAFTNVNKIYFQNKENYDFFVKHKISKKSKYQIVPGSGVNLDKFKIQTYPKNNIIKFAYISRIMKEKGIELYIEAAKAIKNEFPNTEFIVCGFCEYDYQGSLDKLIKEGIIDYRGMIMDIRKIYKEIHCTVFPSYYPEGLSNVLLESNACGRPIITTDRAGCREAIINEYNGYMVKEKDLTSLIEAIRKFILLSYDMKKEMGINGRKLVEEKFNRKTIIDINMEEICLITKK